MKQPPSDLGNWPPLQGSRYAYGRWCAKGDQDHENRVSVVRTVSPNSLTTTTRWWAGADASSRYSDDETSARGAPDGRKQRTQRDLG
jgi:hypothetical protein